MKHITGSSLFARAYIRDDDTFYYKDAMLIAVLAHTHGNDRKGADGKKVRQLLDDVNLDR